MKGLSYEKAKILGKDEDGRPIVAAYRQAGALRFHCPWCNRTHGHGVGFDEKFGDADGHRVPHCLYPRSPELDQGYIVREVKDPCLAGTFRRFKQQTTRLGRLTTRP